MAKNLETMRIKMPSVNGDVDELCHLRGKPREYQLMWKGPVGVILEMVLVFLIK